LAFFVSNKETINNKKQKIMCKNEIPADFLIRSLKDGFPYDETMKEILKKALRESPCEIKMSSEVYLFELKDAKEFLEAYLNTDCRRHSLSINGEFTLLENEKHHELLELYIEHRELDEETQIHAVAFGHNKSKKLIQRHHQLHGLCPKALSAAKSRNWLDTPAQN
jgi:hypothetical protein